MPLDLHSADPDSKDREKFLKKTLGQITLHQKKIQAYKKYFEMPKMKARLGRINPQIIRSNPELQTDKLTNLPRELGSAIWEHINEPADRLMLALTCKFNAGMFEEMKTLKTQPAMTTKRRTGKSAAKPQGVQKQGTETETMTILRRLQSWMKHTKTPRDLCYVCMQFVDKQAVCDVKDFKEKGSWGGRAFPEVDPIGQKRLSLTRLKIEGRRCPVCAVRMHNESVKDDKKCKEIRASLRI